MTCRASATFPESYGADPVTMSPDPGYTTGTSAPLTSAVGEPTCPPTSGQVATMRALAAVGASIAMLSAVGLYQLARRSG